MRGIAGLASERLPPRRREQLSQRVQGPDRDVAPRQRLAHRGLGLAVGEDQLRPADAELMRQLRGLQRRVGALDRRPGGQRPVQRDRVVGSVAGHDRDNVTAPDALLGEPGGEPPDAVGELAVRERAPAARVGDRRSWPVPLSRLEDLVVDERALRFECRFATPDHGTTVRLRPPPR